ncbi:MAG: cytochrome b/b6 domain-containing protein [Devosia sp.]
MLKPARTSPQQPETRRIPHANTVRVWDPLVRLFHWALVLSVATAWFSARPWEALHYWAGLAAAFLIAFRLIWGLAGSHYARFSQFVRSPRTVLGYLRAILTGSEGRYIGHNPAGGSMVIALLITLAATATTGWLMTTDQFWGDPLMQKAHELIAHLLLVLVGLHLAGVALASFRHHENLVRAMITGRKRQGSPDDMK